MLTHSPDALRVRRAACDVVTALLDLPDLTPPESIRADLRAYLAAREAIAGHLRVPRPNAPSVAGLVDDLDDLALAICGTIATAPVAAGERSLRDLPAWAALHDVVLAADLTTAVA